MTVSVLPKTGGTGGSGITQLTGDVTATGPGVAAATLANTTVVAGPYIRVLDIALGGSPFVNAAAGDFRLNNTYGNFIKGMAPPLSWPGLAENRPYLDMGPRQHIDQGFAG